MARRTFFRAPKTDVELVHGVVDELDIEFRVGHASLIDRRVRDEHGGGNHGTRASDHPQFHDIGLHTTIGRRAVGGAREMSWDRLWRDATREKLIIFQKRW